MYFGYVLIGILLLIGLLVARWLDRWREAASEIANRNSNKASILKSIMTKTELRAHERLPQKHYDPQIDDLMRAGNSEAAEQLAKEKLRQAYENGYHGRETLYRNYLTKIAEQAAERQS